MAREVIARNRAPERVNVYEIMAKPALTVRSGMLARYAVRLLVQFRVARALVVDDAGAPCGLVTLRDLVLGLTPRVAVAPTTRTSRVQTSWKSIPTRVPMPQTHDWHCRRHRHAKRPPRDSHPIPGSRRHPRMVSCYTQQRPPSFVTNGQRPSPSQYRPEPGVVTARTQGEHAERPLGMAAVLTAGLRCDAVLHPPQFRHH